MRITVRGSVFETNSSSMHTFIHVSEGIFKAWESGDKIMRCRGAKVTHGETDFVDVKDRDAGCKWECAIDPSICFPEPRGYCALEDWRVKVKGPKREGHADLEDFIFIEEDEDGNIMAEIHIWRDDDELE